MIYNLLLLHTQTQYYIDVRISTCMQKTSTKWQWWIPFTQLLGSHMPRCLEGYIPSEVYLYCYGSLMRPSSFRCIPNTTYANYETPGSRPLENLMARLFVAQVKLWLLLLTIGNLMHRWRSWTDIWPLAINKRSSRNPDDSEGMRGWRSFVRSSRLPAFNLGNLQTPPRWLFSFGPNHSGWESHLDAAQRARCHDQKLLTARIGIGERSPPQFGFDLHTFFGKMVIIHWTWGFQIFFWPIHIYRCFSLAKIRDDGIRCGKPFLT